MKTTGQRSAPVTAFQWFALGLLCLTTGASAVALGDTDLGNPMGFLLAFSLSGAAIVGPLVLLRRDLLGEPLAYYCFVTLVLLGGTALLWLGSPEASAGIQRRDVSLALLVTAGGFVALASGYFLWRRREGPATAQRRPLVPSLGAIVSLAVIGLACKLGLIVTGGSGLAAASVATQSPFVQLVHSASFSLEASAMLLVVRLPYESRGFSRNVATVLLLVILCLALGLNLASGFLKAGAVALIVPLAVAYRQHYRRVPVGAALVAVTLAFLALPVVLNLRDLASESATPASLAAMLPDAIGQTIAAPGAAVPQVEDKLRGRLRQIDNIALVIRDTPSVRAYRDFDELLLETPAVALVPRSVWPDKPVLDSGLEFAREYYGQPTSVQSSIGVTQIGDLYRYGGTGLVIVGMFVVGLALSALRRGILSARPPVYVAAAFGVVALVDIEDALASVASNSIRWAAVTGLLTFAATRAFPFKTSPALAEP